MAIVKMKRLHVCALASDREDLLQQLLRLGCVEISEPDELLSDSAWGELLRRADTALTDTKTEIADVNTALGAIRKYGEVKDGMLVRRPTVSEQEFLGSGTVDTAKAAAAKINGLLQSLTRLQNEEGRLAAQRAGLTPWEGLDLPLEDQGTAHVLFRLLVCPGGADVGQMRNELAAADTAAELLEISGDRQQRYLLLLCHRAEEEPVMDLLRPHGCSATVFTDVTGTAAENLRRLDQELEANRQQQSDTAAALAGCADSKQALQVFADRLSTESAREESAGRMMTDGTIVFFRGWCPAEKLEQVQALLERKGCAWEAADPTEEEIPNVPVRLKNNWFTKPLNMVTDMYSLPAYNGVDPNPLMAPFFILFYGMMMADMGYGLVMMLLAGVVIKKTKPNGPTMRYMMPLMFLCGVSTFLWGAATGGFFGDFLTQIVALTTGGTFALPALFSPLDDAVPVLIGSLILGVLQVFTGMVVSMYKQIKRGETMAAICNEGAWFLVFLLAALGAVGVLPLKGAFIAIVVVLVIGLSYGKKGIVGKVMGIFGGIYNGVTGYFSDILSYSRLMALMLAGAVVAQVFNQLGAMTGNVITFVIIAMIGNALNFALNILGCYVHDMRLQCLEFFGRFYEDGGKPFTPLETTAKYVDVIK